MKGVDISFSNIENARLFLKNYLPPTPLIRNNWLSEMLECDLFLKLENMQPIGSFKIRGASYKISKLSKEQRKRGVISASAGNHAQGVAWGAARLGVKATIVMPVSAPLVKVQNSKALGAEVIQIGNNYDEAYLHAIKLSRKTKKSYIHAFEDSDIMAGQGTIGLEILDDLPNVDMVLASIGGGGLVAGLIGSLKTVRPQVEILGCQAEGASALYQSLKLNRPVTLDRVQTFADGIAVRRVEKSMFRILKSGLSGAHTASDEEIAQSILLLMEKAKVVAEASGAIGLAIAQKIKPKLRKKKVVIVVSGGNVDFNVLGRIIEQGLVKSGRRIRINVLIADIPGSLSRLTGFLAQEGVNILQAIHDRNELSSGLNKTGVELTLETRGPEHTQKLIKNLRSQVENLEIFS